MDWLFPTTCAGCEKPGQRWCADCHQSVNRIGQAACQRCGEPLYNSQADQALNVCHHCQEKPPLYEALGSWAIYEGALHRLKYNHDLGLGDVFADFLSSYVVEKRWPVDLVLPVPLGRKRLKERGYNQAGLLARPVAQAFGWRYEPDGLIKIKDTPSQVGLNHNERKINVHGAFLGDVEKIKGANVLLIDDVTTTGATLEACTAALLEAKANRVWGLTLARAALHPADGSRIEAAIPADSSQPHGEVFSRD
jgi:ComF family protein